MNTEGSPAESIEIPLDELNALLGPEDQVDDDSSQIFPGSADQVGGGGADDDLVMEVHHYHQRNMTTITIDPGRLILNIMTYLSSIFLQMEDFVGDNINFNQDYKFSMATEAQFSVAANNVDLDLEDECRVRTFTFSTSFRVMNVLRQSVIDGCERLDRKFQSYQNTSSGFRFDGVLKIELMFVRYNPVTHLMARSYIPTPTNLTGKHCIVNVQNKRDNLCFLYSILAALHYDNISNNNHGRKCQPATYRPFLNELVFDLNKMPMKIKDIHQFEQQNAWRFAINVFEWRSKAVRVAKGFGDSVTAISNPFVNVLWISKNDNPQATPINLCVFCNDDDENNFHYTWIRNIDRFFNYDARESPNSEICLSKKWCPRCARAFHDQSSLQRHQKLCLYFLKHGGTTYELSPHPTLEFRDWHKTVPPSYIVFADFESILEPSDNVLSTRCSILQKHLPSMAAYLMVPIRHGNEFLLDQEYHMFQGEDCIDNFLSSLEDLASRVGQWYSDFAAIPMLPLTREQEDSHKRASICHICHRHLKNADKVHDHDHVTGMYVGPAHNKCNLSRKQPKMLPIFFHNLRKYDMHHIIRYAQGSMENWQLEPIAQNSETFLALKVRFQDKSKSPLHFLDSCQFLQSSLDNLSKMMKPDDFILSRQLPQWTGTLHKQIFPYSFVTDFDVLSQQRDSLPSYDSFFDVLRNEYTVTENEYHNACNLYRQWGCTSLGDYLKIYLKVDVYLLADCFQYFRQMMLEDDGLEPSHFFSIPGISWASALKRTGCKLETLQDSSMYEMFEAAIRGGLAFVNKHFAEHIEGQQELLYLDVNNLYGWALSNRLPCSDFRWVLDQNELDSIIHSLPSESCGSCDTGYLLEVDIMIPREVHDFMIDLPIAPEHMIPPAQRYKIKTSKCQKLVTTLLPKTNYLVHFRLLQMYMELGAQVTRVHRAISFRQEHVFFSYIEYNTERRKSNTNPFNKNLYKLKNNSLYGKTCENVRKRINLKICNTPEKLIKYTSKITFRKAVPITEDLVLTLLRMGNIVLDKPIYIGQAVLDLSKLIMYDLYYYKLKRYERQFSCSIRIMGGDTDSFFLSCHNVSLRHQLLPKMIEDGLLDTSNYPQDDPLYSDAMSCKIGCVKDEGAGKTFHQFVLLQPKMYSMSYLDGSKEYKRAKGVQRNIVEKSITHQDYLAMYNSISTIYEQDPDNDDDVAPPLIKRQRRFASQHHQLYTVDQAKVALNCRDNKRQWLSHNESIPFGHYRLE